jgi:hypothetical protein
MFQQMAILGGLRASARKRLYNGAIQSIKHLLPLSIDLEGLKYLSLLLSVGKRKRDKSEHLLVPPSQLFSVLSLREDKVPPSMLRQP